MIENTRDWTVVRGIKYVVRLALFIVVPGLHQIACRRAFLGWLILGVYLVASFVYSNLPWDPRNDFLVHALIERINEYILFAVWLLLALDIRNLDKRRIPNKRILLLPCLAAIYFIPTYDSGFLDILVENKNNLCPEICKNDVVEFDHVDYDADKPKSGDLVVMDVHRPNPYLTKVLETPSAELCANNKREPKYLPADQLICLNDPETGEYYYPYLILGGPAPELTNLEGDRISITNIANITGVRVRKTGHLGSSGTENTGFQEFMGTLQLTVYKMTGIKLFPH